MENISRCHIVLYNNHNANRLDNCILNILKANTMTRCYNIKKILELHIKSTMLYDMIWMQDLHNNKTNIKHLQSQ